MIPMQRRFVIQKHASAGGEHYDFMLEAEGVLATWRLDRLPGASAGGEPVPARALPDHRLAYLTYEGDLTAGRGTVRIADRGRCRLLSQCDRLWTFELAGRRVRGRFELRRVHGDRWRLSATGPPE